MYAAVNALSANQTDNQWVFMPVVWRLLADVSHRGTTGHPSFSPSPAAACLHDRDIDEPAFPACFDAGQQHIDLIVQIMKAVLWG